MHWLTPASSKASSLFVWVYKIQKNDFENADAEKMKQNILYIWCYLIYVIVEGAKSFPWDLVSERSKDESWSQNHVCMHVCVYLINVDFTFCWLDTFEITNCIFVIWLVRLMSWRENVAFSKNKFSVWRRVWHISRQKLSWNRHSLKAKTKFICFLCVNNWFASIHWSADLSDVIL